MEKIKKILRPYYIEVFNFKYRINNRLNLIQNFIKDYHQYKKHSIVFKKDDIKNKEADIILHYHSLEKGMLFRNMKKGFAEYRIENLHKMLNDTEVLQHKDRCQIQVAYKIMCQYYELHKNMDYDIEYFYNHQQYEFYRSQICAQPEEVFSGYVDWKKSEFYKDINSDFLTFAHSRKSTREFTGEKFPISIIEKVISLANTAPSVCNRQASTVYLLENKTKIDQVLQIQGGFTGYTKNVNQLLILTNDRKFYYTVGERNQLYIDGGAYLMNLLYALHYYQIGNCPANWGKSYQDEADLSKVIKIPESEKIICMIPIGNLAGDFRTTLSQRRAVNENFTIL